MDIMYVFCKSVRAFYAIVVSPNFVAAFSLAVLRR
jgi:hypothetical protein